MPSIHTPESLPPDLFQAIVAQAPDALIYADRDGIIRIWNAAAESVFGYAATEVLGKNMDIIIPERFRHAHWQGFDKAVKSGKIRNAGRVLTTRAAHRDKPRLYVDLSFSLIKDTAGNVTGVLAIGRDCTERHIAAGAKSQT